MRKAQSPHGDLCPRPRPKSQVAEQPGRVSPNRTEPGAKGGDRLGRWSEGAEVGAGSSKKWLYRITFVFLVILLKVTPHLQIA